MFNDKVQDSPRHRVFEWAEENTKVSQLDDGVFQEREDFGKNVALHVHLI